MAEVSSVEVGATHSCAIVGASRQAMCWGRDEAGQLGRGSLPTISSPLPIPVCEAGALELGDCQPLTGVDALSLGDRHSCALLEGGSVRC